MTRPTANEYVPEFVSVPGETLQEVLDDRGISQAELAERTGRPKKTINEIIRGKAAITPETALQLERVLGIPAAFWNNLERNYRENRAGLAERAELQAQGDWMKSLPVAAMVKKGWIKKGADKVDQLRELLNFFGVATPSRWDELVGAAAFRKSSAFDVDPGALAAWLRKGEIEGRNMVCGSFDRVRFSAVLDRVRTMTQQPFSDAFPTAQEMCASVGVAVVIVPELPKTRVNGATRWLSKDKALLQLSLRYQKEDIFWFSFFHEAAHILLHGKREIFVDGKGSEGDLEQEADVFAGNALIPREQYRRFATRPRFLKASVIEFATSVGVHPGIVVGRLQHEKHIRHNQLNELRRPIDLNELVAAAVQ
ncbi:MAG: HigA family addiction module antitoxin [Acidobacteriota bacterium]